MRSALNTVLKAAVENLEGRQLLTHTTHFYDPAMGMTDSETPTAAYREQKVEVPQVAADGTITVKGTSVDDVITVERVDNPLADKNDGEYDFAKYTAADGSPIWSSGEIDQYVSTDWLADERAEMSHYTAERDAVIAAGNPVSSQLTDEIAGFEKRIEQGENFLNKFESGHFIRVTLQGVYDWFYEISDEQAAHAKIVINGGAGKDSISIATNVPLKATINGEAGADTLTSGKKLARLSGGGGSDRLISRSTKGGSMVGGAGADRYYNRATGSEISITAKADGDQVSTDSGMVKVKTAGLFGTLAVNAASAARPSTYYIVDSEDGKRDLLA